MSKLWKRECARTRVSECDTVSSPPRAVSWCPFCKCELDKSFITEADIPTYPFCDEPSHLHTPSNCLFFFLPYISSVTSPANLFQQGCFFHLAAQIFVNFSFSWQVRGKSKTGCQTWLPPSSIHWLPATAGRLPSPTSDWLSAATNTGLQTPTWSAGF